MGYLDPKLSTCIEPLVNLLQSEVGVVGVFIDLILEKKSVDEIIIDTYEEFDVPEW